MESSLFFLVAVIAGGLFLLWMILYFIPIGLWFQALVSDVKISLLQLVLMRWRKVPPTIIVRAMIEHEMKALAQEMRARVIEAEAEVPRAMAEAFRSGNLGIMDYYKMKNIEEDTQMRESIAKPNDKKNNQK
jgi:uncharacterized protein YqfA (UPF0365 family)